jgi:hypothetical protein
MAEERILLNAKYAFTNLSDLNEPFGTLELIVKTSSTTANVAEGSVYLQVGLATNTTLAFVGPAIPTENTKYITVQAKSHGILNSFPDQPQPLKTTINLFFETDYKTGFISVEGFFADYGLTLISMKMEPSVP